jgi:hypothetical protein
VTATCRTARPAAELLRGARRRARLLASLPLGGADSGIVRAIGSQYLYYLPNTADPLLPPSTDPGRLPGHGSQASSLRKTGTRPHRWARTV